MTELDPKIPPILQALRAGPVGVSSPDEITRARADMMPWLEEQVLQLPQKRAAYLAQRSRRRRMVAGGFFAAAAAVLLAVSLGAFESGRQDSMVASQNTEPPPPAFATLVSGKVMSGSVDVLAGSRLGLSSRVQTGAEQGAELQASSGYDVTLAPSSDVVFLPEERVLGGVDRRLRLHEGSVTLAVAPLPKGSTLSVITEDVVVTVVGTQFSVQHQPGSGSCVRVTEGKVRVERQAVTKVLSAGESWGCEAVSVPVFEKTSKSRSSAGQAKRLVTTLDKESALLSQGLSFERKGETKQALRAYQELIRRYPESGFIQDARAGVQRISSGAVSKGGQ